jgi:putative acetyltransferase
MIRKFESSDMSDVLSIWLEASIVAHSFVKREFWESQLDDMRNIYIPSSDTFVYSENGTVKGFISMNGETIAALFVIPQEQGKSIGSKLIDKAKSLKNNLNLAVYRENSASVRFYQKAGFLVSGERVDAHTGQIELLMEYIA